MSRYLVCYGGRSARGGDSSRWGINNSDHSPVLPRSSVHGGLDVIPREAWPFYRTSSGVRLCWELEEPKGPKGDPSRWVINNSVHATLPHSTLDALPLSRNSTRDVSLLPYRDTSLIRERTPPGPYSRSLPEVLLGSQGGGCFLMSEVPLYPTTDAPHHRHIRHFPPLAPATCDTYRGTSLMRNNPLLEPYSRTTPRVIRWSWGGGSFLTSEASL